MKKYIHWRTVCNAKNATKLNFPLIEKQLNKSWYICIKTYYVVIKRTEAKLQEWQGKIAIFNEGKMKLPNLRYTVLIPSD